MNENTRARCRRTPLLGGVLGICLFLFGHGATAADPMIMTSASRQFIVRGRPQTSIFANHPSTDLVYIHPALLVVTCEHVKQTLARELGWGAPWRGTIFVDVHPARFDNEQPELEQPELRPFRTADGWRYRLQLPSEIDRTRLLESIVEALLVEFADRSATDYSAELPPWLVEGLTAHLMAGDLADLALQPNAAVNMPHRARNDPVNVLRQHVQSDGALSVDQLNWADFDESDVKAARAYHLSAHLFVRELLRLRGGPDCLCAMLSMLPEHFNWQTAFLRGFEPHFHRMVDVEKWWALSVTQLKTRESSVFWSATQAQQKLEEILYTPMQVRLSGEDSTHITPVALQTVINDWDFQEQLPLLKTKLTQLQAARVRLSPELGVLVDGYYAAIRQYLESRSHPRRWFSERNARAAVAQAIQDLNAVDAERARLPVRTVTGLVATKAWTAVREAEQILAEGRTDIAPKVVPLTPP